MNEPARTSAGVARRWLAVGVSVVLFGVVARTTWSGNAALAQGRRALAQGRGLAALTDLSEAESWYLPLYAPWRAKAVSTLATLATRYEAKGDLAGAVRALSALRAGLYSAESLVHPDTSLLRVVNARLAPLMARWEAQAAVKDGRVSPGPLPGRAAHFAAILARDARPSRPWGLLAVLGFALWVLSAWRAAGHAEGRGRWLALSFIGLAGFLLGVALA